MQISALKEVHMTGDARDDLEQVIIQLWRKKENQAFFVNMDEVEPQMSGLGYAWPLEYLAENMVEVAGLRGWKFVEGFDGNVQVLPSTREYIQDHNTYSVW